jgi:dolichol-phosphate mannosyltransferase
MSTSQAFSIIVPTYREANNIPALIERIAAVGFSVPFEVLLMDDNSADGSLAVVANLQAQYPWVHMHVNTGKRDLSQAIISGIKLARYPIVITLDADLSHPPEKIQAMLTHLADPSVDMVIGSRYIPGGSCDPNWPLARVVISRLSALLAWPLTRVRDPLSGFIAVRKADVFSGTPLQPIGWKIGLEIMLKANLKNIKEIPIHFADRLRGTSKLNARQGWYYGLHLLTLYAYSCTRRMRGNAR